LSRSMPSKITYIKGMARTKTQGIAASSPRHGRSSTREACTLPKVKTLKAYALPDGCSPEDFFPGWKAAGATLPEVYFAVEYLSNHFDHAQAYHAVFPDESRNRANICGQAYLRRPTVQKILADYTRAWLRGRVAFLEKEVMDTTLARALYDPAMFLNPDGSPAFTDWKEIPEAYRRCIEGIDVKFWGKDADKQTVSFTLANRSEALGQLMKLLSCIKQGMDSGRAGSGLTNETELMLATLFAQGRKVDNRTPEAIRSSRAARAEYTPPAVPETVITGLG